MGVTGIHTAADQSEIKLYQQLQARDKLTLRVYAWLPITKLSRYLRQRTKQGQGDDMVQVGFMKAYLDGNIPLHSSWMFKPYPNESGNTGLPQYDEEKYYELIERAHANGYQVGVHAMGDQAVNIALNAIERAQQKYGKKDLRHRIEHSSVIALADIKRFNQLGVIASMQPGITGSQSYLETHLGQDRANRVDMWKNLLDHDTHLAWGSDWPFSSINPMLNLRTLVTRKSNQKLTIEQAVKYYTCGPAYASFEENIKGALEVGKLADMVVLSQNIFTVNTARLSSTKVLYTILGGKIIYQK